VGRRAQARALCDLAWTADLTTHLLQSGHSAYDVVDGSPSDLR